MIEAKAIAENGPLSPDLISRTLEAGLGKKLVGDKVLVLIPDHTRSVPLPFLFRSLVDVLRGTKQLDFMVALGTHLPLGEKSINKLVGISAEERGSTFKHIGLLNHEWNTPVRAMIHAAVERLKTPLTLIALVVENHQLSGLFIGDHRSAWSEAADLSTQRHIRLLRVVKLLFMPHIWLRSVMCMESIFTKRDIMAGCASRFDFIQFGRVGIWRAGLFCT